MIELHHDCHYTGRSLFTLMRQALKVKLWPGNAILKQFLGRMWSEVGYLVLDQD